MKLLTYALLGILLQGSVIADEGTATDPATDSPLKNITPELKAALDKLEMPGVKINLEEWCVDVDATVCLDVGLLELVACTKDTKEHESILRVDAKPSHVHTALLLIGARNGSPAMQQAIDKEMTRFRHIMPSGSPIDVYVRWKDEKGKIKEVPINDLIIEAEDYEVVIGPDDEKKKLQKFPTKTFLFAGSMLIPSKEGPKRYLCDETGNVISISTFGDELLCLPEIMMHMNGSLSWEANPETLPPVDTKVTIRLRPAKAPKKAN